MKVPPDCVDAHSEKLNGRIPYKLIVADDGALFFKWIYIGEKKFTKPFFSDSIISCLSLQENSNMPFTTAQTLLEVAANTNAVSPSAFIFHVSRCGSTLLTQMLCIDERCITLSEVPLLDAVLRLPFSNPEIKNPIEKELFTAILQLLGKKRSGKENYLFVKTDSWHLSFFEKLRAWYPSVPALLLFRSPKEVIRSQQKQKGMHAVQGVIQSEVFGFKKDFAENLSPEEYLEKVLEKYFAQSLKILTTDKHSYAVNFHDGPMKMLHRIIQLCDIPMHADLLLKMEERTKHHSKYPENNFSPEIIPQENFPQTELEKLFEELKKK